MDKLINGHRIAVLGNRVAVLADTSKCGHTHDVGDERFLIKWGYGTIDGSPHSEFTDLPRVSSFVCVGEHYPDEDTDADALWSKAEQWVREE
ncbi:hypothetical protein LCGC14_1321050 [marine sediment metagenome]|uniref:Uncharacterized protein n=1 Tax=marine sediment metagenome TaxID=412755 RepID=A0A0F9KJL3_9ZZZZ